MQEQAFLLDVRGEPSENRHVARVLDFFGVASRALIAGDFLARISGSEATSSTVRLLCSADTFLHALEELDRLPGGLRLGLERIHSVFVYAGRDPGGLQRLARRIFGDGQATLGPIVRGADEWVVTDRLPDFCGVMSGARTPVADPSSVEGLVFDEAGTGALGIIACGGRAVFAKLVHHGVPVFLSTAATVVDLDAPLAGRNFDLRDHFLSATPLVLYTKWAFAETCWQSPDPAACLIIDDPLLRPRYGFVDYQSLLGLMERHNFSTSIAFIPWNWRRSASGVARLFKEKPERYSLSVHGCDHTGGEFGTRNAEVLAWKAGRAMERMSRHESRMGIGYDPVMVFPQGVFSGAAPGILKRACYTAAVNTEVLSVDPAPPAIRISDVWDVAVMNYDSFPIFTRRYPSQGVANFAFDILLGKPCLAVIHHDFCRDRYANLVEFIQRLNALNCRLSWCSLGEVVRRGCRQRTLSPSAVAVEMYGSELRVENRSGRRQTFEIRKRESSPSAILEILTESRPVSWNSADGHVAFAIELDAGQSAGIRIAFRESALPSRSPESVGYRLKTMARRYLSEARDNYDMRLRGLR